MSNKPVVSIFCLTYNHRNFIKETLDGFLMQKTSFPFEVLVHDDASTDGTAEIIMDYTRRYPHIFKPIIQKENQYSKGVKVTLVYQLPRAQGKYIAMCEGDDYWIDPFKLQKQVDFLESNEDYGLVYTKALIYSQEKSLYTGETGQKVECLYELIMGNQIPTLTVLFRKYLYFSFVDDIDPFSKDWKMGDYPLWLYLIAHSKVHFSDYVSSVYRVLQESASHSSDIRKSIAFMQSTLDIQLFFAGKYALDLSQEIRFKGLHQIYHQISESREYKLFSLIKSDMLDLSSTYNSRKLYSMLLGLYFPELYRLLLIFYSILLRKCGLSRFKKCL